MVREVSHMLKLSAPVSLHMSTPSCLHTQQPTEHTQAKYVVVVFTLQTVPISLPSTFVCPY